MKIAQNLSRILLCALFGVFSSCFLLPKGVKDLRSGSNSNSSSATAKSSPSPKPTSTATSDSQGVLYLVRFDAPLQVAEIHRNLSTQAKDVNNVKASLARTTGCQNSAGPASTDLNPFGASDDKSHLSGVSAKGYAGAQAVDHPLYVGTRLRMYFNLLQPSNPNWEWSFQIDGTQQNINVRPASQLSSLTFQGAFSADMTSNAGLTYGDTVQTLANQQDLNLTWAINNLVDIAYVVVEIGRPNLSQGVYCVFDASKNSGTISAAMLANLPSGVHTFFVNLYSAQIQTFPNSTTPPWVFASYDWRLSRVTKS